MIGCEAINMYQAKKNFKWPLILAFYLSLLASPLVGFPTLW